MKKIKLFSALVAFVASILPSVLLYQPTRELSWESIVKAPKIEEQTFGAVGVRYWVSGFELNSTTNGVEWDSHTGTVTIDSTTKHSGSYAMRFNANNEYAYKRFDNINNNALRYLKMHLYVAALPTSGSFEIMGFSGNTSTLNTGVILKSTGKIAITDDGVQMGSESTNALSTGQWYYIEFQGGYGVSATREVKVNGSSWTTATFTETTGIQYLMIGLRGTANSADLYIDDVVMDESQYPGDSSLAFLLPNAAGDSNQWQHDSGGAGDSNNYAEHTESPPPDDATSYVRSVNTDANLDLYQAQDMPAADSITAVYVHFRSRTTGNTGEGAWLKAKEGGSTSTSVDYFQHDSTNTWATWSTSGGRDPRYLLIMTTKPSGGAWTESAVNSMQIGFESEGSFTITFDVSQVWAYVEYIPSAAPPPAAVGDGNTYTDFGGSTP